MGCADRVQRHQSYRPRGGGPTATGERLRLPGELQAGGSHRQRGHPQSRRGPLRPGTPNRQKPWWPSSQGDRTNATCGPRAGWASYIAWRHNAQKGRGCSFRTAPPVGIYFLKRPKSGVKAGDFQKRNACPRRGGRRESGPDSGRREIFSTSPPHAPKIRSNVENPRK